MRNDPADKPGQKRERRFYGDGMRPAKAPGRRDAGSSNGSRLQKETGSTRLRAFPLFIELTAITRQAEHYELLMTANDARPPSDCEGEVCCKKLRAYR